MKLLGEGLLVTVFAMAIVFCVLIALMCIIKLQTLVLNVPYKKQKQIMLQNVLRILKKVLYRKK